MIDLHTLSTLLSFNDAELIKDMVGGLMGSPQVVGFLKSRPRFEQQIRDQLGRWSRGVSSQVLHQPVPDELEQEFRLYQETQQLPSTQFQAHEPRLIAQLAQSPFLEQATTLVANLKESNPHLRKQLFLSRWRDDIVNRLVALELALADQERERMLHELEDRVEIASTVEETLQPDNPGKLWDLSAAKLLQGDTQRLRHYAQFLARNAELRQIAEELGRAAADVQQSRQRLSEIDTRVMQYEQQDAIPDDLVGVHQSSELQHLLPSQTMLLGTPELETLFYQQMAERRLLNYHFMGQSRAPRIVRESRYSSGDELKPKGPFIVCIDTSGSMSGYPEQAAKAICMALLQIAISEDRPCIIQLFSTEVISYELTGKQGLQEAVNFLGCSFKGGTDLAPCIATVLEQMQQRAYQDADAIVLSDFIAQRLPNELREQVRDIKRLGNRFNAICLSRHGKPALMKIFDAVWRFDTGLKGRLLRRLS